MDKKQFFFGLLFASLLGGIIAIGGYKLMEPERPLNLNSSLDKNVRFSNYTMDTSEVVIPQGLNFVFASKLVTPAVVHIRTVYENQQTSRGSQGSIDDIFRDYFDGQGRQQPRQSAGSGSGATISSDGYIITNNHVVDNADEIEVLLNDNQVYKGKVIGTDPTTDIALVKIDANNLPTIKMGDSDKIQIGEWVLAVGSPFGDDFRSTVTAGIVSAKGRSIQNQNIGNYVPFIQTDVAINPGNSGGPLFDLDGKVVGINSQIYSRSGGYQGLAFAIPIDVAMEVANQIIEDGGVSRGYLGVRVGEVDNDLAEALSMDKPYGALITDVEKGESGDDAGLQAGDVIIEFNGKEIKFGSDLPHVVGRIQPNTKANAKIIRDGKDITLKFVLGELPADERTFIPAKTEVSSDPLGL